MEIQREPLKKPREKLPAPKHVFKSESRPLQDLSFLGGPRKRKGRKLIEFQILSALVDGLIIFGFTLIISSGFLNYFKIQALPISLIQILTIVFCWFQFCYLVLLRSYLGYTIGEKVFEIRLGTYQERFLLSYPFRVIYRTLIILGTGILVFPLLSWIFKKDLVGEITQLKIVSLV